MYQRCHLWLSLGGCIQRDCHLRVVLSFGGCLLGVVFLGLTSWVCLKGMFSSVELPFGGCLLGFVILGLGCPLKDCLLAVVFKEI